MRSAKQRGLLLIETLTAILLFSIGVLGTVSMQARSIRHIDDANYRGEALHLAQSLIARMWSEDPRTLIDRYDRGHGGDGYRDFAMHLDGSSGSPDCG